MSIITISIDKTFGGIDNDQEIVPSLKKAGMIHALSIVHSWSSLAVRPAPLTTHKLK